jgi:hypothetical protein
MSFFSDLFEGNFNQLGGDLTSPTAISEYEDAGIALGAGALAATGIGAAADAGLFGALGAGAADLGAGALADTGTLAAADAGLAADVGSGAALAGDATIGAGDALAFAPAATDALSLGGDASLAAGDATLSGFDSLGYTAGATDYSAPEAAAAATDPTATATVGTTATGTPGVSTVTAAPGYMQSAAEASNPMLGGVGGASPAVTPSAAPAASTSLWSQIGGALSSPYGKLAMGIAPLGVALAMGQPSLGSAGQAAQASASQLAAYGQQQLALGTSGQLTPAQSAVIGQMQQDLTNQWRQALANQGVQDPTKDGRWPQIQALIDQQVTAATQTMIQQTIQNGLTALGQGGQQLAALSAQQMQADQNFANMLVNATKGLGSVFAGQTTIKVSPG